MYRRSSRNPVAVLPPMLLCPCPYPVAWNVVTTSFADFTITTTSMVKRKKVSPDSYNSVPLTLKNIFKLIFFSLYTTRVQ